MSQFVQRLLAAVKRAGGLAVDDAHCTAGLSPEEMTVAAGSGVKRLWRRWFIPRSLIRRSSLRLLRCAIAEPAKIYSAASWTRAEKGVPTIPRYRSASGKFRRYNPRQNCWVSPIMPAWKMAGQINENAASRTVEALCVALCRQRVSVYSMNRRKFRTSLTVSRAATPFGHGTSDVLYAEQVRREKYALDEAQLKPCYA